MKSARFFLFVLTVGLLAQDPTSGVAQACGGCHGGCQGGYGYTNGGGYYGGVSTNPAGYGYRGYGRYPLRPFWTPLRGPGALTPVRQFLFGRGRYRRIARRAFFWGGARPTPYMY